MVKKSAQGKRKFGQLYTLGSGRIQARYTGPDGRRHPAPMTFEDSDAATAWLLRERRLLEEDPTGWTPPKARAAKKKSQAVTFGAFAERWLLTRKVKGRPLAGRTRDHYQDLLDRFILPTFEETVVKHITPEMVDDWYDATALDTPTYRAHAYGLLRTILKTAVERNVIPANPAHVRGAGSVSAAHDVETATLNEVATIVAMMPAKQRLMILLGAWCSNRYGEIAELRRRDIDLKRMVIRVRREVVWVKDADGRYVATVKAPKTDAGSRDAPIPPHLVPDIKDHLKHHAADGLDGLLFPNAQGGQIRHSTFYGQAPVIDKKTKKIRRKGHGWYAARHAAGRPDLHFHDLRHTALTNAAIAGATIAELMALAGHSTPAAAMRYQHAARDRMQDLAKRLSEMAVGELGANEGSSRSGSAA
ncbi:tyrosine-type recombinase/integrase [Nocardioides sp. NPDC057772]|uniref:tyrosine-type recombinase/integrase n=1 Tax=Nocardioides sp. NPDC057772 TaxID=3346245 RepID=UPI0002028E11|nr:integrase [Nocardioidaceae bacterium Broad-1]